MRKLPTRRTNEITQQFNSGVVNIYAVENVAEPGYKPQEEETLKYSLRYEEQRLGIQRFFYGKQNMIEIERIIRIPRAGTITNQDVAQTEDGKKYSIVMVQSTTDVYPPSLDLTLADIKQKEGAV